MKCVYCGVEIQNENYSLYSCDGDFIHNECKNKQEAEIANICNMKDSEFEEYMENI